MIHLSAQVDAELGKWSARINNSTIFEPLSRAAHYSEARMKRIFNVNVIGVIFLAMQFLAYQIITAAKSAAVSRSAITGSRTFKPTERVLFLRIPNSDKFTSRLEPRMLFGNFNEDRIGSWSLRPVTQRAFECVFRELSTR